MQLLLGTALAITAEFYRGKGSQQSGSFAALLMLSVFELIMAFNYTFRMPFDAQGGTWMLELSRPCNIARTATPVYPPPT